jgi:bifunctional DNA-binding transcriptional regulator/antitoxin component of YhaV-PrlF toxin-antitoxin module
MKLQAQASKSGEKKYPKYVIVLPKEVVEKAGFEKGDELEAEAFKGEITIRKAK